MVSGACVWRSVGGVITDRDKNADHCSQPPSVSVLAVLCRIELQTNIREDFTILVQRACIQDTIILRYYDRQVPKHG